METEAKGTILDRISRRWSSAVKGLGFRIALSVGLILALSYILFVYLLLDIQEDFYFKQLLREADRFSAAVINATNHSMLKDNREATSNIVADIGKQPEISVIRIYDHDGVVRYSNEPIELGKKVNKKAEACFACHSEDKPFSQVASGQRARIHYHGGYRVLGMITPIYNEKSCYTAACHAHPKGRRVLGVLDVGMSLKAFDAHVGDLMSRVLLLSAITFASVIGALTLYVSFRVVRPVTRLRDATRRIALGDFSGELPIAGDDQIGQTAWAFNLMRDQVRRRTNELIRSREEYKALFEQVPCFICVINQDYEIVRQNSNMRELFRGCMGMKCYEVFKQRSEKCPDCHVEVTFRNGQTSGKEHCGLSQTGEETNYVSYTKPIVNEDGRVIYAMLIAVDIGDRVRLQRALQASRDFQTNLIENSIHGIIASDNQGRVTIYNVAAESLLGHRAQDVVGDTRLERYFPREFVAMLVDSSEGKPIPSTRMVAQETIVGSADGQNIPVRFSGLILFGHDGMQGAVGFFQDLRVFKKLEREKQESDRLAAVGQTVAGLAHGVKNILTGLEGGVYVVETALEDNDRELLKRGWKMLQNNINRISDLVKDLLSYSKGRKPQYEHTDPNALAEEVCALFDASAREKSITIERDFDPAISKGLKIYLDQRGIHTCLSNLVANAIDACDIDKAKPEHRIVVKTARNGEDHLVYQISDDGAGMSEDTKRKIFSTFYSTKGSRGTGLGLMVSSKIVMEHHGRILFDSEEGAGATFTIILPSEPTIETTANLGSHASEAERSPTEAEHIA